MTLRHIKPRTPEWQEALESELRQEVFSARPKLSTTDLYHLRQILELEEELLGMPSPWQAARQVP